MRSLVCAKAQKGAFWVQEMKQRLKGHTMYEATTNTRTRDAIRTAHAERGAILRGLFRRK